MGILCSAGDSASMVKASILSKKTTLTMNATLGADSEVVLPLGVYQGDLPEIPLLGKQWHSRNNQFALAVLKQIETDVNDAITRFGANRVGVIIGTSTSSIAECEVDIREWVRTKNIASGYDYGLQEMGATAQFVSEIIGAKGPSYGISTACSSGAKSLAAARRLIRSGVCDAVVAGGVDTLCQLTVQGFSSLEAVSNEVCNPFSRNRKGINIGEGAALFLVTAESKGVELLGVGESSDAHHISAPDPSGCGAIRTMKLALVDAELTAEQVGYVNLHGTATRLNDQMEATAMHAVFGSDTPCSSTKPFIGHTLGAAGAIEAGICYMTLELETDKFLPIHLWDGMRDPSLPNINLVSSEHELSRPLNYVLSNSFAFGGNNISLILGKINDV